MYPRTRVRICLLVSLSWSSTEIFTIKSKVSSHQRETTTTSTARQTHLCKSWKIEQGEIEHTGAAYRQVYRQLKDAFVLASNAVHLLLDLAPGLVEIDEGLVEVEKFSFSAIASVWSSWRTSSRLITIPWPCERKLDLTILEPFQGPT